MQLSTLVLSASLATLSAAQGTTRASNGGGDGPVSVAPLLGPSMGMGPAMSSMASSMGTGPSMIASMVSSALASSGIPTAIPTAIPQSSRVVQLTPAQSSQAACLQACKPTDVNCRSACVVQQQGDYGQQNRTINCISSCDKGNGTGADIMNFEKCQRSCISAATLPYELPVATPNPAASRSGAGAGATNNAADKSSSKTSGGSGASGTANPQAGAAAEQIKAGIMGILLGLASLGMILAL